MRINKVNISAQIVVMTDTAWFNFNEHRTEKRLIGHLLLFLFLYFYVIVYLSRGALQTVS